MDDALENACNFLQSLQRFELAALLKACSISIEQIKGGFVDDEWFSTMPDEIAVVVAPPPVDEALRKLPDHDRKRISQAVVNGFGRSETFEIDVRTVGHEVEGAPTLLAELVIHRAMMISVSTGGELIQEVDDFYRAREARIREHIPADVQYENPHGNLWDWYHFWKEQFGTWAERRHYINKLFAPAIETLAKRSSVPFPDRQATGWERVDRTLATARADLERASNAEDFQAIGLKCREALISLGQSVYDPSIHISPDGVEPSQTDGYRMINAYIAFAFAGESQEEVRKHARASLSLANALQHRRTATRQLAALCFEATSSTVAVISIIAR